MRYLSTEWIEAVGAQVAANDSLAHLCTQHDIGVTQVVTDTPHGEVTYHFQIGPEGASFGPGPAPREHVRLQQTWDTSVAVATNEIPAQEVFVKGLVKITGDIQRLIDSQIVFGALESAFETVRAQTQYT